MKNDERRKYKDEQEDCVGKEKRKKKKEVRVGGNESLEGGKSFEFSQREIESCPVSYPGHTPNLEGGTPILKRLIYMAALHGR